MTVQPFNTVCVCVLVVLMGMYNVCVCALYSLVASLCCWTLSKSDKKPITTQDEFIGHIMPQG